MLEQLLIQSVLAGLTQNGIRNDGPIPLGTIVGSAVTTAMKLPEVKNATNQENPVQSRVVVGSTTGLTASLAVVLTQLSSAPFPHYDWNLLVPALVGLWGSAYALYGRLWSGLAPLFGKKTPVTE